MLIIARSNQGKTTVLINLLMKLCFYQGYFHRVYVWCPAIEEDEMWRKMKLHPKRKFKQFTLDKLQEIVEFEKIKKRQAELIGKRPDNILFVIDDEGSQALKYENYQNELDEITLIIRHLGWCFIMSTQQVASLSTPQRNNADGIILFPNDNEYESKTMQSHWGNGLKGGLNYAFSQLDPSKREFLWINRQKPLTTYQINFNGKFL
jgi:hypothetical protein